VRSWRVRAARAMEEAAPLGLVWGSAWPSGAALRGEAPSHPEVRRLKTVVPSVGEKAV